ncbi:MAG TPA: DUF6519 domain-containing protein, partial [Acidimicrobiales bacterium]|nr:DUF6519 domain-containing protein [Acidimicrobiales bacterium]
MGSDRARNSYDPARRWRKVVAQQGRVTVEADDNEAWTIANEERREETLDVVGPTGTPDDGYRVDPDGSPAGLSVGPGTFYVGGLRHVTEGIVYGDQEEWLDRSDDPDWTEPDGRGVHGNALVWWWGREHEVGATEDPTLREVALGGPDTSQRERVVQRVKLFATEADDCSTALDKLADAWAEQGLWFDPDGMRLRSDATLAVDFTGPATAPDPCEPEAVGGYLGADNQLVRVQVSSWDAATGTGTLLWGVDNASFLYRVDVVDAQTLRLRSRPVDDFHQPQPGQAVEVLRCAARLGADEYVASATGEPFTLTSAYAPDTQRIALPGPVSAATADPNLTPAAFLRVWEEHLPFTPGTAVALGTTGLEVTLKTGGVAFHPGDHWLLAVRPATPTQVYPARFLDGPQSPDGPRLWAAPLAVVQWGDEKGTVLDDCRDPFDNLVDLTRRRGGGCCEVMLRPEDVQSTADLRAAVDKANGGSVCLRPGVYELDEPLRLGPGDEGLELAGCHGDVVFRVAEGSQQAFEHGMVLVFAHRVSIKGIRFAIPAAPAKMLQRAAAKMLGTDSLPGVVAEHLRDLVETVHTAIAVRAVHAHWLRVEACRFDFPETEGERLYGAAVHASGACRWLRIVDNLVVGEGHIGPRPAGAAQRRMLYGLLSVAGAAGNPDDEYGGGGPPLLDEA